MPPPLPAARQTRHRQLARAWARARRVSPGAFLAARGATPGPPRRDARGADPREMTEQDFSFLLPGATRVAANGRLDLALAGSTAIVWPGWPKWRGGNAEVPAEASDAAACI